MCCALLGEDTPRQNMLVTADGLTRNDQYGDAAGFLLNAVRDNPHDGEAWLALGNVLRRPGRRGDDARGATRLSPRRGGRADSPGVPFFIGVHAVAGGQFHRYAASCGARPRSARPQGSDARKVIEDRIASPRCADRSRCMRSAAAGLPAAK